MDLFLFPTCVLFSLFLCLDNPVKLESSSALALCFTSAIWVGHTDRFFNFIFPSQSAKVASGSFNLLLQQEGAVPTP